MKLRRVHAALPGVLAALWCVGAWAADLGALVGLITDGSGTPLPHATVSAIRAADGAIRATLTGSDGVYSFGDLPSGIWSVSVDAAGFASSAADSFAVLPGKATRHDLALATGCDRGTGARELTALLGASLCRARGGRRGPDTRGTAGARTGCTTTRRRPLRSATSAG